MVPLGSNGLFLIWDQVNSNKNNFFLVTYNEVLMCH